MNNLYYVRLVQDGKSFLNVRFESIFLIKHFRNSARTYFAVGSLVFGSTLALVCGCGSRLAHSFMLTRIGSTDTCDKQTARIIMYRYIQAFFFNRFDQLL